MASKWQPIVDELASDPATYDPLDNGAAAAAIEAKTESVPAGEIDPYLIDNLVPNVERSALRSGAGAFYDKWQAILNSSRPIDVASADFQQALTELGPGGAAIFSQGTVDAINALQNVTRPISQGWGLGRMDSWKISKARKEMT